MIVVMITPLAALATTFPEPKFPIEQVEASSLTVEYVYNYFRLHYRQPLKIQKVTREKADYATPEGALAAFLSAILSANKSWYLDTWDEASRKEHEHELTNNDFVSQAAQLYSSASFYLLSRIERKDFVILEYVAKFTDMPDEPERIALALEKGQWKATNKYASDFFVKYNTQQNRRIKLPGEPCE